MFLLAILLVAIANFVVGSFLPPRADQIAKGFVGYNGKKRKKEKLNFAELTSCLFQAQYFGIILFLISETARAFSVSSASFSPPPPASSQAPTSREISR